ncbi:NAD(P)-dependent oxidoreductase [Pseudobacteriovorax antillogorgiicola]|uniref:Glycerate dehydrogenase n=1 Tax=Pseudobacteriovorax antillogorgiicola TaxID=1513793 RepID=A0A1Y6C2B2_9BACT|nr:NAD(P)-dependent oxidoreductase [Pseudobacteriovorax antillogorgiicola]TCS50259.1 glycerate dehydrogenase [Pseudobacteriovorax antillogorgiicola]SMF33015.1 glycerate dehydrogenase [Pseudobacteriovorax antillogorgiicola]
MKAALLDRGTLSQNIELDELRDAELELSVYELVAPEDIVEVCKDCAVIITNKVVLNRKTLSQLPRLKLICLLATGANNIDLAAAQEYGITVCNARDYCTSSVAQHTFALILNFSRSLHRYHSSVQNGDWQKCRFFSYSDYPISQLDGQSLLIFGQGVLGLATGRIAEAFGMNVYYVNSKTPQAEWQSKLASAHWVSLHCPSNDQTRHMVNRDFLTRMNTDAYLINTARGDLVVPDDLIEALDNGWIAGAALDVLPIEPPPSDSLLLQKAYDNLIITPHIAWASREAQRQVIRETLLNIEAFRCAEPRNGLIDT